MNNPDPSPPRTVHESQSEMSEFVLPYDDVRGSASPNQALLEFMQSTYEAGANLAKWDRAELERGG